jgi:hypothetical protein
MHNLLYPSEGSILFAESIKVSGGLFLKYLEKKVEPARKPSSMESCPWLRRWRQGLGNRGVAGDEGQLATVHSINM